MDRKEYLKLCQQFAVNGRARVKLDGILMSPYSYELSFDKSGNSIHSAILKDLKANSVTKCRLDKVEEFGGDQN